MLDLIIIGARGLGRALASQARSDVAHGVHWRVAGFLDTDQDAWAPETGIPLLGSPLDYKPHQNDIFLSAIGNPDAKRRLLSPIIQHEPRFMDLRTDVTIGERTSWGSDVSFGRRGSVGVDCRIGSHVFIESHSILGHDVHIGNWCHIGGGSFVGGYVEIGEAVMIHPRASIARGVKIGDGAVIGLGSVVLRDVPPNSTVLGNPARVIR